MTLQTSGAISLANVNAELGLTSTTAISLNDSKVRSLAGVSSGAVSLKGLYGKSSNAVVASLTFSGMSLVLSGKTASASVTFNPDGTITNTKSGGTYWYGPTATTGIGASYWISINGGSLISLATAQGWAFSRSAVGTTTASGTFKIYSDQLAVTVVSSGTYSYTLTVESGA